MASTTPSTTAVLCPGLVCGGKCDGETVQASGPGFAGSQKRKTVTVTPCSVLTWQGWTGNHQVALYPDQAVRLLVRV
jgi:hypothetical protein